MQRSPPPPPTATQHVSTDRERFLESIIQQLTATNTELVTRSNELVHAYMKKVTRCDELEKLYNDLHTRYNEMITRYNEMVRWWSCVVRASTLSSTNTLSAMDTKQQEDPVICRVRWPGGRLPFSLPTIEDHIVAYVDMDRLELAWQPHSSYIGANGTHDGARPDKYERAVRELQRGLKRTLESDRPEGPMHPLVAGRRTQCADTASEARLSAGPDRRSGQPPLPHVWLADDGSLGIEGRHRLAVLRDHGCKAPAVQIALHEATTVLKLIGLSVERGQQLATEGLL